MYVPLLRSIETQENDMIVKGRIRTQTTGVREVKLVQGRVPIRYNTIHSDVNWQYDAFSAVDLQIMMKQQPNAFHW